MKNEKISSVIIKYIDGSKKSQIEEFKVTKYDTLTIGRSVNNHISFENDTMVSRSHAEIEIDKGDQMAFTLTDKGSTNGTFLNGVKISGGKKLSHGDSIRIGKDGPQFSFEVNPVPAYMAAKTQVMDIPAATMVMDVPQEVSDSPLMQETDKPLSKPSIPIETKAGIGKDTVERMIHKERKGNRNLVYILGALLLAVIAAGLWWTSNNAGSNQPPIIVQGDIDAGMSPYEIAKENNSKCVYIEAKWKLIHTPSGQEIFHEYSEYADANGQPVIAANYILLPNGKVEPLCTSGSTTSYSQLLGSGLSGSGFFVSDNGHIITNRHVAASWNTSYTFPQNAFPGVLWQINSQGAYEVVSYDVGPQDVAGFVPANLESLGKQMLDSKYIIKGENEFLDVVLSGKTNRIPASIASVSDNADVTMIKINLPGSQPFVSLDEKSKEVDPGKEVVVMGYPSISPNDVQVLKSQDYFNQREKIVMKPEPVVTNGTIAKIMRAQDASQGRYSSSGELYQLNINTTGSGNSGGPVFDKMGNVIGIYTSGTSGGNMGSVSFAVPIKYALDIMGN